MACFSHSSFDDHEQVLSFCDRSSGLKTIIAIHSTHLGPGSGGVRMVDYACHDDALDDALRLSQAMSYKNAMAGLALGGAKAVIIGDPKALKTQPLLKAFGKIVDAQAGHYITAGDVGIVPKDMVHIAAETDYVAGIADLDRPSPGDPAPYTAHGLMAAISAALQIRYGSGSVSGKKVSIQGIGKVGSHLAEALHREGARLIVTGRDLQRTADIAQRWDAQVVSPDDIMRQDVDVFSPCALGGILHKETIEQLKCAIIVGGANNQLSHARDGALLHERGIMYVPDYVANAGGMIMVALDYFHHFTTKEAAMLRVEQVGDTVAEVLQQAKKRGSPTNMVADLLARRRIGRR